MNKSESNTITLKFPFIIDNEERTSILQTNIEHSQGVICFTLPFQLTVTIPSAIIMKREQKEKSYLYIFEFNSLNDALKWLKTRMLYVEQTSKSGDVYSIQKEMDEFMREYDEKNTRKKKKVKITDDDGFTSYV